MPAAGKPLTDTFQLPELGKESYLGINLLDYNSVRLFGDRRLVLEPANFSWRGIADNFASHVYDAASLFGQVRQGSNKF
jgi:hypothetical protein